MNEGSTPEKSAAPDDGATAETARLAAAVGRPARARRALGLLNNRSIRRTVLILVGVVLGAVAGAGYGVLAGPTYRAAAFVAVSAESGDHLQATAFASAFGRIAAEGAVLAPAARELGLTAAELTRMVEVQTSPDAPMIEIAGTGPDPERTHVAANAVADNLVAFANQRSPDTRVRLSVFAPAVAPLSPSSASAGLLALVGGAGGLLVTTLVVFALSDRIGGGTPPVPAAPPGPGPFPPPVGGSVEARNGYGRSGPSMVQR